MPDASAGSLHHFLTHRVEPGASVITDGWIGHLGITGLCYGHVRGNQRAARGEDPGKLLPRVNRVAGLARRWCQVAERRAPTSGPALANRSPGIVRSGQYPMAGYRRIADDLVLPHV